MRTFVTMIALLGLVAVAQAGVAVVVDPGVDVGSGLTSFTVRLVADDPADTVTSWQGSFDGPMNQVKELGIIDTPTLDRAVGPLANEEQDSHLLLHLGDLLIETSPSETAVYLGGTFGIKPAATAQDLAFAQIVLRTGDEVLLSGTASNATGVKFSTDALIVVPEPATMLLLGIGGIGALIRRRRK